MFIYFAYGFASQRDVETIIGKEFAKDGYDCQPLVPDSEYALLMTYDQCMSKLFSPPTNENMIPYGVWEDTIYGPIYDGPWNFTYRSQASYELFTFYHQPFPTMSNMTYTFNRECALPKFNGYEKTKKYSPDISIDHPLKLAVEESIVNCAENYCTGFGPFGISNKKLNASWFAEESYINEYGYQNLPEDYVYPIYGFTEDEVYGESGEEQFVSETIYGVLTFHVDDKVDYVSQCENDSFPQAFQDDLFANGTYAFPKVWSTDSALSEVNKDDREKVDFTVQLRPRSLGITPFMPMHSMRSIGTHFSGKNYQNRCDFADRQIAKETYEYVYSWPNCHPCDSFKRAPPFSCSRSVPKGAIEILALSLSNTLFFLSWLVWFGPILFMRWKRNQLKAGQEEEPEPNETVSTRISSVV